MRLVKTFGLAALTAVAAMAFVGATSASAESNTVLCKTHPGLLCPPGEEQTHIHFVLAAGTIFNLLASINILCLGLLRESEPLSLGNPQIVHNVNLSFSGCGTGSAHNNCTITIQEQPLAVLLKTGLDEGVLTAVSGRMRAQCANLGIDCVYDLEGAEFSVAGGHATASETTTSELGGKFFCPDEGLLDVLLETLLPVHILR